MRTERIVFLVFMNKTVLALALIITTLISAVATTGNGNSATTVSSEWVEVAKKSGAVASGGNPEDSLDVFSVEHLEWRVRWSVR